MQHVDYFRFFNKSPYSVTWRYDCAHLGLVESLTDRLHTHTMQLTRVHITLYYNVQVLSHPLRDDAAAGQKQSRLATLYMVHLAAIQVLLDCT